MRIRTCIKFKVVICNLLFKLILNTKSTIYFIRKETPLFS